MGADRGRLESLSRILNTVGCHRARSRNAEARVDDHGESGYSPSLVPCYREGALERTLAGYSEWCIESIIT